MRATAMFFLLATVVLVVAASACAPSPPEARDFEGLLDVRDDAGDDGDWSESAGDSEVEDEGADQDCFPCNTPCRYTDVVCGTTCCIENLIYPSDGGEAWETICDNPCPIVLSYSGMLVLDFELNPSLVTDPRLPQPTGYAYRGDGTELVVVAGFADGLEPYSCINRCYPSQDYLWVLDIETRTLLHAGTNRSERWCGPFGELLSELYGPDGPNCHSPIPEDGPLMVPCGYRADVSDRDESFYVGWHGAYYVYGFDRFAWRLVDRRPEEPILPRAMHIYRTSTGSYLESLDLRLVEPGTSNWQPDAGI